MQRHRLRVLPEILSSGTLSPQRHSAYQRGLALEPLEDRRLLTTTINANAVSYTYDTATSLTKYITPNTDTEVIVNGDIGLASPASGDADFNFIQVFLDAGETLDADLYAQRTPVSSSLQSEMGLYYYDGTAIIPTNNNNVSAYSPLPGETIAGGTIDNGAIYDSVDGTTTSDSAINYTVPSGQGGFYYICVGQAPVGTSEGEEPPSSDFPDPTTGLSSDAANTPTDGKYQLDVTTKPGPAAVAPVTYPATVTLQEVTKGDQKSPYNIPPSLSIPVLTGSGVNVPNATDDGVIPAGTLKITNGPTDGKLVIDASTDAVVYTPNSGFFNVPEAPNPNGNSTAPDSFTYTVTDENGLVSLPQTITINVTQVITPPVITKIAGFTGVVAENAPTTIPVLAGATDVNDTIVPSTVTVQTQPAHGTISGPTATGALIYTPTAGYVGPDSFTFTVADNYGAVSTPALVTFQVIAEGPIAVNDTATTNEDTATTINELANDQLNGSTSFVDSSVAITAPPTHGTATVDPTTGQITYTPTTGFFGTDTIQYTVNGSNGKTSNIGTISITVAFVDIPPVANNDTASTNPGVAVPIDVLSNDTDINNDIAPGSVAIASNPSNGTVSVNATTGVITYTPNAGYAGTDTFTYTVATTDNGTLSGPTYGAVSNTATVTVTVHQFPVATAVSTTTAENSPVTINVASSDTSSDSTIVATSVAVATQPAHGTATVDPTTGLITYTPSADYYGPDSFTYTVADAYGVTSKPGTVSVNVTFVPQPPVAVADNASTPTNTPVNINVLANDIDYDSMFVTSSVTVVTQPLNGTAVANSNGTITYTPKAGYTGGDQFTYTVSDGYGAVSAPGTVNVRVGAPVSFSGVVYIDPSQTGVYTPGESVVPGVTITLTKTDGPVTYSVSTVTGADGSYSFTEATTGQIMPAGTYSLTETPTIYFVDGKDTAPAGFNPVITQNQFADIQIAAGQSGAGFNFGEKGLSAAFVAKYFPRSDFFASSTPTVVNLDLAAGPAYFSIAGSAEAQLAASAVSSGQGSVKLTLLSANLQPLATDSAVAGETSTSLDASLSSQPAYLLEVSGTDPSVTVTALVQTYTPPAPAPSWHNGLNPLDVNGDGKVTAADAIAIINALNSQGSGALGVAPAVHEFLDVKGNGSLSPVDAIEIINYLNQQAAAAAVPAAVAATSAAPAADTVASFAVSANVSSSAASSTSATVANPAAVAAATSATASPAAALAFTASTTSAANSSTSATTSSSFISNRLSNRPSSSAATDAALADWDDLAI